MLSREVFFPSLPKQMLDGTNRGSGQTICPHRVGNHLPRSETMRICRLCVLWDVSCSEVGRQENALEERPLRYTQPWCRGGVTPFQDQTTGNRGNEGTGPLPLFLLFSP